MQSCTRPGDLTQRPQLRANGAAADYTREARAQIRARRQLAEVPPGFSVLPRATPVWPAGICRWNGAERPSTRPRRRRAHRERNVSVAFDSRCVLERPSLRAAVSRSGENPGRNGRAVVAVAENAGCFGDCAMHSQFVRLITLGAHVRGDLSCRIRGSIHAASLVVTAVRGSRHHKYGYGRQRHRRPCVSAFSARGER